MKKIRENGYFKPIAMLLLLAFFSVFVIFASFSSSVQAQQTDIEKILEEGKKAYLDGDYERAIQLLNQAILLIRNKSTLIDAHLSLALTYFTVNQIDNCKEQIKSILKLNPSFKPDPEFYSPKFIRLFEDVKRENTREAIITSIPEGATISIDDENKGITPFKGTLYAGKHRIKIVKEGFEPLEREINVERLKENVFEFTLAQVIPAEKPVEEKPIEKPVEKKEEVKPVEEKPVEEVPIKEKEEKPEKKKSYTVFYILGGLAVAGVALALLLGKKKEEGKGNIDVKSVPTGAKIYLDGADTGKVTNAVLTDVKAGGHSVTLKKDLWQDYTASVNVPKGGTASVNATLQVGGTENFNDGVADGWVTNGNGRWTVEGGVYRFDGGNRWGYATSHYDLVELTNFTCEVRVNRQSGPYPVYGLAFRGNSDLTSYYLFDISTEGSYSIFKIIGTAEYILRSWTSHSAIRTGLNNWNTLKVVASGSTFTFYINETLITSITDGSFTRGKIGLWTWGTTTGAGVVLFDDVKLSLSTSEFFKGELIIPRVVPYGETSGIKIPIR